jgi:hypothetical protein
MLPGSNLDRNLVVPAFKAPFDIIHCITQENKNGSQGCANCLFNPAPFLDELRTYCYEHQIEEVPAALMVL